MRVFDGSFDTMAYALNLRSRRQNLLSESLANLDTPGFRPRDVDFESSMQNLVEQTSGMRTSRAGHMGPSGEPAGSDDGVVEKAGPESAPTPDGNTVDLDRTMSALAQNAVQYSATTKVIQKRLAILKYVASDGTTA